MTREARVLDGTTGVSGADVKDREGPRTIIHSPRPDSSTFPRVPGPSTTIGTLHKRRPHSWDSRLPVLVHRYRCQEWCRYRGWCDGTFTTSVYDPEAMYRSEGQKDVDLSRTVHRRGPGH